MKKIYCLILICCLYQVAGVPSLCAQNQEFSWVQAAEGPLNINSSSVAVDSKGNTYTTGKFFESITFGNRTLKGHNAYHEDIFICKYDAAGKLIWAKKAGGDGTDLSHSIAVDAAGNVYVTDTFYDTVSFGSNSAISKGARDIYIAKYDASGKALWLQAAGKEFDDYSNGIALDKAGNAYITGLKTDIISFGEDMITGGNTHVYVAKYSNSGKLTWDHQVTNDSKEIGNAIALDGAGHAYITGNFYGTSSFDKITLTSGESQRVFVAKLKIRQAATRQ